MFNISVSLKCHTSPGPLTRERHGEGKRLNSKSYNAVRCVTYFSEYAGYFLIGYYLSEILIENILLLAECAKEYIRFEIVLTG